jgi:hypothetical protein
MSGQLHASTDLLPVPIKWDAVWAHSRSGRFGEENSLAFVCKRIAIFFVLRPVAWSLPISIDSMKMSDELMLRLLYHSLFPLDRKLLRSQSWSRLGGEEFFWQPAAESCSTCCGLSQLTEHVELLVSRRVPPRVMLARYWEYRGNNIPGADRNQYRYLAVDRGICEG